MSTSSVLRMGAGSAFDGSSLAMLPWGGARFDCVLVSVDHARTRELGANFADQIVRFNNDYISVTGPDSEFIHDLVDKASVRAGRQEKVGDGDPMTTWHHDATTIEDGVKLAYLCPGGEEFVLCLVVGSPEDLERFITSLDRRCTMRE
jgi:hypothetical protein